MPRAWFDYGAGAMTVAEIDPVVTEIAVRDFWFDPSIANVLHEDARRALRDSRHDVGGDAYRRDDQPRPVVA